eukprot:773221-Rhodomonas_salina.1
MNKDRLKLSRGCTSGCSPGRRTSYVWSMCSMGWLDGVQACTRGRDADSLVLFILHRRLHSNDSAACVFLFATLFAILLGILLAPLIAVLNAVRILLLFGLFLGLGFQATRQFRAPHAAHRGRLEP